MMSRLHCESALYSKECFKFPKSVFFTSSHILIFNLTKISSTLKMSDNADVECSENKVEGEDSWRTVNCLRGRLLAERMASRNARGEADQLEIKLLEMEMLLEQEGKSRKRAEKKLKWLRKKLQCINISDESQQSSNDENPNLSSSLSDSCGGEEDPMALVPVEMSPEKESAVDVDPEILDETVRQVLESLRHAKEQIQSSMERRRRMSSNIIIKVG